MLSEGYWNTIAGKSHRHRWRHHAVVRAWVNSEPERKGRRGTRSGPAFRHALATAFARRGARPWPRAKLAVDLDFVTARPQPPSINALAKHHLDLLGSPRQPGVAGAPLLYRDDEQVKMLYVSCQHAWDADDGVRTPRTALACRTRADAIAELEAAHDIVLAADVDLDEDDPWGRDHDCEAWTDAAHWLEMEDGARARRVAAQLRLLALRGRQDRFLGASDRWLTDVFRFRGRELLTGRMPRWRRQLQEAADRLDLPRTDQQLDEFMDVRGRTAALFRLRLPPLPTRPDARREFREELEVACNRFVADRRALLDPLVAPLRVTILHVPPRLGAAALTKDLDNLAQEIVPVIKRCLQPPQDPWVLDPVDLGLAVGPPCDDAHRRRALARLRQVGHHAVLSYQAMELHRRADDPPEGWLAVVLGHGENCDSLWEAAEHDVDRMLERLMEAA